MVGLGASPGVPAIFVHVGVTAQSGEGLSEGEHTLEGVVINKHTVVWSLCSDTAEPITVKHGDS